MQIKHTFLFTFVLGLVWTGVLFAFSTGPDPFSNGISDVRACSIPGCHVGNSLNAPGGSVSISGLPPAGWVPGQTYTLTVTVQRPGQSVFGYQLSAVADLTGVQAGVFTLVPGNNRSVVAPAGGIQFAQHSSAHIVTSSYPINWTAPSSAGFGTVRFNVAGNAANGNFSNTGDFIYTGVVRVSPLTSPTGASSVPYAINDRGGSSSITDGSGDLNVGYARIRPTTGSTTPAGVGIFGFRQNNILVTEAGVPASPLVMSGRIFAEVNGPVNTGLAIANPNDQIATINFSFTNTSGTDFRTSSTTIGPNQQIASFLNEAPWLGGSAIQGAFSFTSSVPVSVIALRGFTNERGEFLITTLPVTDVTATPTAEPVALAHFADGEGWRTQIVLVNPTDATIGGTIQFLSQGTNSTGTPVTLVASAQGGAPQVGNSFAYSIPRRSSFKLVTAGTAAGLTVGSVRVNPNIGGGPSSLVIFSYRPGSFTVTEAGVPAMKGNTFRMYVEATGAGTSVGTIQTGLAIANLSGTSTNLMLELFNLNGTTTGMTANLPVPGNGQTAKFIHELFTLPFPFKGILRITGGGVSGLSVVGLRGRYNERGDFLITTTPPSNEVVPASTIESLFPHLVNGGGYTTQFILFSGSSGQAPAGNLQFFKQDGTPLELILN